MNNFASGLAVGLGVGGIVGFFAGAAKARKTVKNLQDEMEELEMFYEEQISKLEDRVRGVEAKVAQTTYKGADDEDIEVLDDDEWGEAADDETEEVVTKVAGTKVSVLQKKIHPMNEDEAMEMIDSHKAKLEEVWLFSCGTLTKTDKETPIIDSNKVIGYDILNRLTDIGSDEFDGETEEGVFPYFVYNENNSTVYEILKEDRTYREYMATVG